jgi:hypothetical protein
MTQHHIPDVPQTDPILGRVIDGKRLVRPLGRHRNAERFLAHDLRRQVDRLVYLFDTDDGDEGEVLWSVLRAQVGARRPHTVQIEEIGRERAGLCWAVSAYPGNHESLVTLESLRQSRGGRLTVHEVARGVRQLLSAVCAAHRDGIVHGPIGTDEVLVSPRGTLLIELYALDRALAGLRGGHKLLAPDEARRDEIRSVASLAWTLLTGFGVEEHEIFAAQARRTLDRRWLQWIEKGLDPVAGFADADEALALLPDGAAPSVEFPAVRPADLLGRISRAVSGRRETAGRWSQRTQED